MTANWLLYNATTFAVFPCNCILHQLFCSLLRSHLFALGNVRGETRAAMTAGLRWIPPLLLLLLGFLLVLNGGRGWIGSERSSGSRYISIVCPFDISFLLSVSFEIKMQEFQSFLVKRYAGFCHFYGNGNLGGLRWL